MRDFQEGIKKEIAEIKFLIHDLRVEKFINDVIHFHVTLNTDLEIFNIEQVAQMHSQDLYELKTKAQEMRKAFLTYSNAVKSFSPPQTILATGNHYIETVQDICELIINPLWGRFDKVISFLPKDCRSAHSARHYKNGIRWICGVYFRIEHFITEKEGVSVYTEFDIGFDTENFARNVIRGYVTEKSSSRVDIYFDGMDTAVVGGNKHRFRRMLFNLVMNSVDAMADQQVGMVRIGVFRGEDRVRLVVKDNGCGMTAEKRETLLSDRLSLDGELHSLGFVFVRQTVKDFKGEIDIESAPGSGTTITVSLPYFKDKAAPPRRPSRCERFKVVLEHETSARENAGTFPAEGAGKDDHGALLLQDFKVSRAAFKGAIFAISVDEAGKADYFTHRPYEEHWDISHEDLSPQFFEATIRGRLEEDDEKKPELILKAPHKMSEYFDFKGVDDANGGAERFRRMVRDEYIRTARHLIRTGLSGETTVHATDLKKFFPDYERCFETEPFPLERLARQRLTTEDPRS